MKGGEKKDDNGLRKNEGKIEKCEDSTSGGRTRVKGDTWDRGMPQHVTKQREITHGNDLGRHVHELSSCNKAERRRRRVERGGRKKGKNSCALHGWS